MDKCRTVLMRVARAIRPGSSLFPEHQKHHYADHIRSGSMCEGARSATVMFCMAVTLNRVRQHDPQSAQALCEA